GVPRELRLEENSQVEELGDLGRIQRDDRVPAARVQHNHALGLERGQRLAQRAPADTQPRRHLLLAQHLARREEPVQDRVTDLLVDLLGQRSGRRDEKFWRHRYCTSFPWPVSSSKTYSPARKVL